MPESAEEREKRGREAAIEGFANELIACGILMKRYGNASQVSLPLSSYDIIVARKMQDGSEDIIRVQSKTASSSVHFVSGSRGGVDRTYKSGVKEYIQTPKHSDCVMGVHHENNTIDLYFVPTLLIKEFGQKSISLSRIQPLKNNYDVFEHCKDRDYILKKAREYHLIT
ncbi:MAG: hypothetical protein QW530_00290 [Candidatus Micrarchaeaceae archaeon]